MEDAVEALKIAFGALVFVLAITVTFFVISQARATAETVFYVSDKTNFYDNVKADKNNRNRVVGLETVIPTLYRYYRENFIVQIVDKEGKLLQLFDTTTEAEVSVAAKTIASRRTEKQDYLIKEYGGSDYNPKNMYGAPWVGTTDEDAKARIDFYVKGVEGYINNTRVDYSNSGLLKIVNPNTKFEEIFTEYQYDGDTIKSEDEEIELVGNLQAENKIIITYKIID